MLEPVRQSDMSGGMSEAATEILLVDDEAALREPLADYLARQGFVVTQAASAAEARGRIASAHTISSCSTS
jgi:two-component system OmpR family response regulator